MAYEITNTSRGPSIIRVVDPGAVTVNIANLAIDSAKIADANVTTLKIGTDAVTPMAFYLGRRDKIVLDSTFGSGSYPFIDSASRSSS